jgi:DNA-binding MarR family transcriptional regulator
VTQATSDEFALGINGELMRCLWRLNHSLERASRRTEAAFGVTIQQRMIVRSVGRYPGMTMSQLARHFHLDPGTVSVAVNRLEQKGLLERRRTQRDRRRVTLGLTASGRALDGEAGGLIERVFETLASSVSPEDIGSARRVLEQLALLIDHGERLSSLEPQTFARPQPRE